MTQSVSISRPICAAAETGGPRGAAAKLTPSSEPIQFFNLFWDSNVFLTLRNNSNKYMYACCVAIGAGSEDNYPNFKPFSVWELKRSLGFLLFQGCHPAPHWRYHFRDPRLHPLWGKEFLRDLFDGNSEHRFQEFKTFFHFH